MYKPTGFVFPYLLGF